MLKVAFSAIVSGRVQLVMYRDFTKRAARRLHIVGEVRNLPDGTVSVIAEGERANLETLLTLLKKGPLLADVKGVEVTWGKPTNAFSSFAIRYS